MARQETAVIRLDPAQRTSAPVSEQSIPAAANSDPGSRAPQRVHRYTRGFPTIRVITALVLREMSSTYGRTPAGFLWVLAEPIAAIALLSAVFSAAFREPGLGTNFPLFYATGYMPFVAFSGLVAKIGLSLTFSRQLLAYPIVTWIDAVLARLVLNGLVDILVALIIFTGIIWVFDVSVIINIQAIALALIMAQCFALGLGLMNAYLFLQVPSWQRIFNIIMRPMFILSCVFFMLEDVPQPYQDWLWWNPVVHMTAMMRVGFYASYQPDWISLTYVFSLSGVLALAGMVLLRKSYQDLLSR